MKARLLILSLAALFLFTCESSKKKADDNGGGSANNKVVSASDVTPPPNDTPDQKPSDGGGTGEKPKDTATSTPTSTSAPAEIKTGQSSLKFEMTSTASSAQIKALAQNANSFSFKIYGKIAEGVKNGNVFISPLSIRTAFALLYPATKAGKKSFDEISSVLTFDKNQENFYRDMKGYLIELSKFFDQKIKDARYEWSLVNRVWVDQSFDLNQKYLDVIKVNYNSSVGILDFHTSPEPSRLSINKFVEESTKSMIKDLLPEGSIKQNTSVVLTNSVYMLADWLYPFPSSKNEGLFKTDSGESLTVPVMTQTASVPFFKGTGYKAVSLPYVGDKIAMLIVLPDAGKAVSDFEKTVTQKMFNEEITAGLAAKQVEITMPKFTFTFGSVSIKESLSALGLVESFKPTENHFPDLLQKDGKPVSDTVYIQDVFHQAKVVVDEKGTEAAAATAIVVGATSSGINNQKPETFIVDHPALFYIYDKTYGSILFMGRLANPKI
ncbi:MAG: serpin family protein [Oligoflexales bacterium]|nr:serpin family protein [Oligoflexales bacterium]